MTASDLSPLKQALLALERLQARVDELERGRGEPIAIVGVGCRLPGGIDDTDALWQLLRAGGTTRVEVPAERWDIAAHHDPDPTAPGKVASRYGHFLRDVAGFDAAFFGVSPREAERIDPQHRLLAEVAWEALEDAGVAAASLAGTRTGVFAGIMSSEYGKLLADGDPAAIDTYWLTGNEMSFAPGRIAYLLGLQGPCLAIDTACSSSLVAVHQACRSLRAGECDLALAGGVSLVITPELTIALSKSRVMAADGLCKTFDAGADGLGRGEGAAMIVLRRLADAERDGDRIVAVIRGSAINHDGASGGLTVPSGAAQEALVRAALVDAGVEPRQVGYHEAHGTGTELGDLIETRAIAAALGRGRDPAAPLRLGALKANIGHLDAAAGIAGLVKAALVLARREFPPHPTLKARNQHVPWDSHAMTVPTEPTAWPDEGRPRIAGVSAFGLSGINAHVVLAEPPAAPVAPANDPRAQLLVVSARNPQALQAQARAFATLLQADGAPPLAAVAAAAARRRDHHEHRLAVVGASHHELAARLRSFADGDAHADCHVARARVRARSRIVFVFPGQGSQWPGMGRQLLAKEPAFRAALAEVDVAVRRFTGWSPSQVLAGDPAAPALTSIDVVQPTLFAVSVALAALWRAWGVEPDVVVGHSMGEVAAACVAGALSLDDAAQVICERSRLMRRLGGQGAMAAVELAAADVALALARHGGRVTVAALNGPRSTVIAGDPAAIDARLAEWQAREVFCRRVKVDVASHSPMVDPLRDDLLRALAGIRPRAGTVPLHSTVTGERIHGAELDPAYWWKNLRDPVRFAPVIERLLGDGHDVLLEVSPHPVVLPFLSAMAAEAHAREPGDGPALALASLRRDQDERAALLAGLAAMHVHGHPVAWARLWPGKAPHVALPRYPWQRQRHWLPSARKRPRAGEARREHPLLGSRFAASLATPTQFWQTDLAADDPPWLADHKVQGATVLPGAATLEMALAAAEMSLGTGPCRLADVAFSTALVLAEHPRQVQLAVTTEADSATIQLASRTGDAPWTIHATARATRCDGAPPITRDLAEIRARCRESLTGDAFYKMLARQGLDYGPAFRGVQSLVHGPGEALAELRLSPALAATAERHRIHPALLDAGLHTILAALPDGLRAGGPALPIAVERVRLHARPGAALTSHVRLRDGAGEFATADIELLTAGGEVIAEIVGLRVQRLEAKAQPAAFAVAWEPTAPSDARASAAPHGLAQAAPDRWLVVADPDDLAPLTAALARRRQRVTAVALDRLAADLGPALAEPARGVVCLFPRHASDLGERGWLGALDTIKALVGRDAPPRLWLVTRQAQDVGGESLPLDVPAAMAWGLGRTVAYEHPELRCTRVDVPVDGLDDLASELLADRDDDEVALRPDGRRVARIVPRPLPPPLGITARPDATYLLTGGLGGLGLEAARWLVQSGARHLVLVGRSGVGSDVQVAAIAALAEAGAQVVVERADVADPAELARVLASMQLHLPPLAGVIHAAGVLHDGLVVDQDRERLRSVFGPKVRGAWNLHQATRDLPLDFFVLYSSASSLFGSPGQANYAAANAFVDALAVHRRASGLPALAIHWGAFAEVGLAAARADRGARLAERGMASLDPSTSGPLLGRLLAAGELQLGVAAFDPARWLEYHPQIVTSGLFARLREQIAETEPNPDLQAALAAAAPPERARLCEQFLRDQVAQVLRLSPTQIDHDAPLKHHGVDSLMAIELKNRVHARLGVRLPVVSFLQGTTLRQLGRELGERWTEERLVEAMRDRGDTAGAAEEWEVTRL
ncbi:myxalamid-type polyketide synthase MxaE and MxaD [Nannocystis exedens]|uniref:Myxalamid-type polyketide synthase MxaE and MxaD n=1 Tax=Nannocystis exedens TaxID=54 RepID=A0A1I2DYA5_9BACT|nr:type I polyketide synthase [Nannocystis exedens]PCC69161.1 polyketide synthase [Nannocystis exedens]SFE85712.1 myxalamid-type polyketide synthase MxaE and MxaD [Nannocystis exedens]